MKTSELTDVALDWAVAKCEGKELRAWVNYRRNGNCNYSQNWSQGGPIIQHERITLDFYPDGCNKNGGIWCAQAWDENGNAIAEELGDTILESAMRCYVASKLGDEVEIPAELK